MALLEMWSNGTSAGTSMTSTISGEAYLIFFLIVLCIGLIIGFAILITKVIELIDEKKKYYQNLNKPKEIKEI